MRDSFHRFHNYLRISLTEKCNFRCTYCMPENGVKLSPNTLSTADTIRLARLFIRNGVTKIRLTGGEPTVNRDLVHIVAALNDMRKLGLNSIGLTSNGLVLKRLLPSLKLAGLNHVNVSLDTLDPLKFQLVTRRKGLDRVLDSIHSAVALGFDSVKINTVVVKGFNTDQIMPLVELTKSTNIHQRFIEYMPFDGNTWNSDKFIDYKQMLNHISSKYNVEKSTNDPNDTTKYYKIPSFQGRFGFITSMSDNFCSTCNRVRLLADGSFKVCLFGDHKVNLLALLRSGASDELIVQNIQAAILRKKEKHDGMIAISKSVNRPMILIGG
jgi:molybdenum cofactor biosynthesis protein A